MKNQAVSEIIGSLALIAIIGIAVSVFASLYLPNIKPSPSVRSTLTIACDHNTPSISDSVCDMGMFPCSGEFNSEKCIRDCKERSDMIFNTDYNIKQNSYNQCLYNCNNYFCSDPNRCEKLYICHKGGDELTLSQIKIFVNKVEIIPEKWNLKAPRLISDENYDIKILVGDNFSTGVKFEEAPKTFITGDIIQIPQENEVVNDVSIVYIDLSGRNEIITQKLFGND